MKKQLRFLAGFACAVATLAPALEAGNIVLASTALERDAVVAASYRPGWAVTGRVCCKGGAH